MAARASGSRITSASRPPTPVAKSEIQRRYASALPAPDAGAAGASGAAAEKTTGSSASTAARRATRRLAARVLRSLPRISRTGLAPVRTRLLGLVEPILHPRHQDAHRPRVVVGLHV